MSIRIVLTGGLSGGHTYPLIAVARALRTLSTDQNKIEFLYIGARGRFESEAMSEESIPMRFIWSAKWRRYVSFLNIVDLFKFPIAFLQALWHLFLFMPDAVFAKGAGASVPVVLAAWLFRIPVMLHDSDAVAGRANRLLIHFAERISIAYDYARRYFPPEKVALTGNPIREEFLAGNANRARERWHFEGGKPVLLIVGGSLGASVINEAVLEIISPLLAKKVSILHITGEGKDGDVIRRAGEMGIRTDESRYSVVPFLDARSLSDSYAASDLVISRAGANSIAEIAAQKKAAILIPLMSAANDEQRMNAYEVAENGGAVVLEEPNLGPHIFLEKVEELLNDEALRKKMGEQLSHFYHPNAAIDIARGILSLISH